MGAYDGTGATAYRRRHLITGKCFLEMLGVFAEFATNLRRERQLEGITKPKAAGVYQGRRPSIDAAQVRG
jgi:DNA invertase Pin-like site-specific DNA recombinase